MTSSLQMITAAGTRLNVILTPQLAPLSQMTSIESPPCQLDVIDNSRFAATVPHDATVRLGSYARLVDTDWPDKGVAPFATLLARGPATAEPTPAGSL